MSAEAVSYKSHVKLSESFTEQQCLVSLLSIGPFPGHGVIVVESIKTNNQGEKELFVGHYDIQADLADPLIQTVNDCAQTCMLNVHGRITAINAYEGRNYSFERRARKDGTIIEDKYSNYSSKNWHVTPQAAQRMIDGIKAQKEELDPLTEKLTELQEAAEKADDIATKKICQAHMKMILVRMPLFQLAGSKRATLLGGNGGENCVTWAEKFLRLAGIDNGHILDSSSAPPQLHATSSCLIL